MARLPITPLRRSGRDFVSAAGADLTADKVRQTLATEPGELPWRSSFGAGLEGLLHRRNDATTSDLARIRAQAALAKWVPDARVRSVGATRADTTLALSITYELSQGGSGTAEVEIEPR
jgi:phage baseplate assembly protein W